MNTRTQKEKQPKHNIKIVIRQQEKESKEEGKKIYIIKYKTINNMEKNIY